MRYALITGVYRKKMAYIEIATICAFRCPLRALELLYSYLGCVIFLCLVFYFLFFVFCCGGGGVCIKCVKGHKPYLLSVDEALPLLIQFI